MKQIKWFERKFEFTHQQNIFPSIIDRLEGTAIRLAAKIKQVPDEVLEVRMQEKWSIKENIGHLIDLEPIWQARLDDIMANEKYLRTVDLENRQTDLALHNKKDIAALILGFKKSRNNTLSRLRQLTEDDIYKSALHPRIKKQMRVMDLFLFVAEHDDHHLVRISEIKNKYKS